MPDEKMPRYWGKTASSENEKTPVPNDGGQRSSLNAKLLEYNEESDYVYVVSDATQCYHEAKAEQVVREFIWCAPDIFIIFDRIESSKAEYPKTWLYHTAAEPTVKGNEFVETSQGGKSICRTLLPKRASISKVGGKGKQFWSDGKNWPLPDLNKEDKNQTHVAKQKIDDSHPLFGQWRIEISPKRAAKKDYFLNIVQVGDKSLQALPKTKMSETPDEVILSFDYNKKGYRLTFDKRKNYGCKVEIR